MGWGSEKEIGQFACTPPLLNPLTVLAGQQSGTGKRTHTHTHTHMGPDGQRMFNKMEPVGVERALLHCVMSSTQPSHLYVIALQIRACMQ